MNRSSLIWTLAIVASLASGSHQLRSSTPRFYDDVPIAREVDTKDAIGVQRKAIGLSYDVVRSLFATPGDRNDMRALNLNTIDEVPDSSWFVDRMLARGTSTVT